MGGCDASCAPRGCHPPSTPKEVLSTLKPELSKPRALGFEWRRPCLGAGVTDEILCPGDSLTFCSSPLPGGQQRAWKFKPSDHVVGSPANRPILRGFPEMAFLP